MKIEKNSALLVIDIQEADYVEDFDSGVEFDKKIIIIHFKMLKEY